MHFCWWTYRCGKVVVRLSVQVKEEGGGGGNMGVRTKKRKKRRRRMKRRVRIPKQFSLPELKKG